MSLFTIPAQSEQDLYVWTEHACKRPSTCEQIRYVSTEPPTDIGHCTCEWDYSPWQCFKACNTMAFHIPWHTSPGRTIYHAMSTRPYHIPCDARQAIAYTMPWPSGHTIYHAVPTRPYHTPFLARQAIPNTMPCPPGNNIYHAMPARPYHILYHARQAIPYTMPNWMPCLKSHTIYHAMSARPYYTMWCPQGHTISHTRPYHNTMRARQAILYTVRGPQAIPYTITCSQGQTI